jgi:hypothetical protein
MIMRAQIGDCPKLTERRIEARCDPYSPTLWPLFAGDSQRSDQEP